jgi:nitrite reductase/ring-hydroxylating ferredoxin subunit
MPWTSLCKRDELIEGQGKYVEIGGFQLAVFLNGSRVYTIDNTCPHAGGSLKDGWVEEGCAVCPLHGWAFVLENGELRNVPGMAISTYPTRLLQHEGTVLVQANLPIF